MLNIFADSMLIATRSRCVRLRDIPANAKGKRRHWFNRRKTVCVDPSKL